MVREDRPIDLLQLYDFPGMKHFPVPHALILVWTSLHEETLFLCMGMGWDGIACSMAEAWLCISPNSPVERLVRCRRSTLRTLTPRFRSESSFFPNFFIFSSSNFWKELTFKQQHSLLLISLSSSDSLIDLPPTSSFPPTFFSSLHNQSHLPTSDCNPAITSLSARLQLSKRTASILPFLQK